MSNQRILMGAAAALTFNYLDADGAPKDAVGTLTVGVTRGDGSVVLAAGTATSHGAAGSGAYTVAVTGAQTFQPDLFTATWTDSGTSTSFTSLHEIVGGYVFTIADARAFAGLADTSQYPNSAIIAARAEVEDELERIRDVAFVPRYQRIIVDGTGDHEIVTGTTWLRKLRSVKVLTTTGASTGTSFTSTQLAACQITDDGRIRRGDGDVFDYGVGNIVVEVEWGFTDWGSDLKIATLTRLRERLNRAATSIPERATAFTSTDGFSYKLDSADVNSTGNPAIDAVYARYPRANAGPVPASRTMSFEPQYGGVFRGWSISR